MRRSRCFEVTAQLQTEGVTSFSDSFAALLGAIVYKQKLLSSGGAERVRLSLGDAQPAYDAALAQLVKSDFLKKLWAGDASLWSSASQVAAIVKASLGWLTVPQHMLESVPELRKFGKEIEEGFDFVVVCGMGGSSLAPDILAATFGQLGDYPQLLVLDSTSPAQIRALEERIRIADTLFIISSKSGTTTEPNAFYAYFHEKVSKERGASMAGRNFVAITDPGSPLETEAKECGFRATFDNDPNIGGRYSALSDFGIVPSAVAGYDINLLLDRALGAMHADDKTVDPKSAPGVILGAVFGGAAANGRNKLTIVTHPDVRAFGDWAEQLIAESTGKDGKGIVPVVGEALGAPGEYSDDRLFVYVGANLPDPDAGVDDKLHALESAGHPVVRLAMNDEYDLGEQFYLWEVAVAAAGSILGIDAFDQPNVQESKDNTVALLAQYAQKGRFDEPVANAQGNDFDVTFLSGSRAVQAQTPVTALSGLFAQLRAHDYAAITAFIARNDRHGELLDELRLKIRDAHKVATTVGFGPRFLHSTGQLHKGGPDECVALQIVADDPNDMQIPGMHVGFRTLLAAQALGDWQSLDKRNRRGVRIHLKGDVESGLRALIHAVDERCRSEHDRHRRRQRRGRQSASTRFDGRRPHRRPVQHRVFWCERRPVQANAAACGLLDASRRDAADRLRAGRLLEIAVHRRKFSRVLPPATRRNDVRRPQTAGQLVGRLRRPALVHQRRLQRHQRLQAAQAATRTKRQRIRNGRQSPVLHVDAAAGIPRSRPPVKSSRPRPQGRRCRLDPYRRGKTVRHRPRVGSGASARNGPRLFRDGNLSYRSLPR